MTQHIDITKLDRRTRRLLLRRYRGAILPPTQRALGVSEGLCSRVYWGKAPSARVLAALNTTINALPGIEDTLREIATGTGKAA